MTEVAPRKRRRLSPPSPGPYVLKKVLDDIPLQAEDNGEPVSISCVELWNDNLYIGTTASEILHLVCLPREDNAEPATFILASRLQPSGYAAADSAVTPGVQQIVVLPGAMKACVLCNGTTSFYTLPELSPAFPNREVPGVQWIGGIDENEGRTNPEGTVVMIANARHILQVRIGEKPRPIKNNIHYPGCLRSSRRDTIACVADSKSYALLEVEHQAKIPLFPISSAQETEEVQVDVRSPARTTSPGHGRSTSLGNALSPTTERDINLDRQNLHPHDAVDRSPSPGQATNASSRSPNRPRSSTTGTSTSPIISARKDDVLKPHILTPNENEFMLTTGTTKSDPGVALFVNLDGDPVRGTLDFDSYPDDVSIYDFQNVENQSDSSDSQVVIALIDKSSKERQWRGLQIQRLADAGGEMVHEKTYIEIPAMDATPISGRQGLHVAQSSHRHVFTDMIDILQTTPFRLTKQSHKSVDSDPRTKASIDRVEQETALFDSHSNGTNSPNPEYEQKRIVEELKFVQNFGHTQSAAMFWSNEHLWQLLPNPLVLRLEYGLTQVVKTTDGSCDFAALNVSKMISFLGSVRDHEFTNEAEFLALKYIRQKASLMLFLHLLAARYQTANLKSACKIVESALHEGEVDPRVPLLFLSPLSREVMPGTHGIWLYQGIVDALEDTDISINAFEDAPLEVWEMAKRYLSTWQEKRGYGSISDDKALFDSIDSALLRVLLHLDKVLPTGEGTHTANRAKLNNVVDHWKGDFDRAVLLLEHYRRLFVLSRLYQSRKSSKDVLMTWQRICEGDNNADEDVSIDSVFTQMRKYLTLIRDPALVQQFGLWLAQQKPELAVAVFADDNSRIKFTPPQVVALLKEQAPNAVQQYLEHLVFAKHLDQYSDDLVGYYLDSVLSVLENSESARQSLADSYSTYRALTSPKPTYLNFIIQNAPDEAWWKSRLRLLHLLGSGGYATTGDTGKDLTYSIDMVLDRLKPFSKYLVSESIILDARQGRHHDALKLLTHGLGDFDTAVRYCYFGGPTPPSGTIDVSLLPSVESQRDLYGFLFSQFLLIEDEEERLERTSHLLGTFASWFDLLKILNSIPDDWSVKLLQEFLVRSFRAARSERNQAIIVKALSAAQNLQKQAEFIEICEKFGAKLEIDNSNTDTEMGPVDDSIPTN